MKNWIMRWVASGVALLLIVLAYWEIVEPHSKHFNTSTTPGIWVDSPTAVIMAVLALGLANSVVRPIILFFAMPINCLTFGLFGFALNALLFFVVGHLGFGFHVNGLEAALIGSIGMGFLSGVINFFLKDKGEKRKKD